MEKNNIDETGSSKCVALETIWFIHLDLIASEDRELWGVITGGPESSDYKKVKLQVELSWTILKLEMK